MEVDVTAFENWLAWQTDLPLVAWGPQHSQIAMRFAMDYAAGRVRRLLDEALNSGDGTYKP